MSENTAAMIVQELLLALAYAVGIGFVFFLLWKLLSKAFD